MAHILIAENTPSLGALLAHFLESGGHTVAEASQGRQAMAIARRTPIELFISDLSMPETDGWEGIRRFCRACLGVPILAVGGDAFQGQVDEPLVAEFVGVDRVLPQHFSRNDLLAAVGELLARHPTADRPVGAGSN